MNRFGSWIWVSPVGVVLCFSATAQVTHRVSVDTVEVQGNDLSRDPSISADGRFLAFDSFATNLVSGDTNGAYDVFVRDRQFGVTERVSVGSADEQGDGSSRDPSISDDGRFVAFWSLATNLVDGDTNGTYDVFVRDRQLGVTERVSIDTAGVQGNGESWDPSISGNGRYVAFYGFATNLVGGDTNGTYDVFVRDRQLGVTERVSVDTAGVQGNNESHHPSISADGRYVAFYSLSTNLVGGDTNARYDVFVRDRQLGVTERVSLNSAGVEGDDESYDTSISADGRYVAFQSLAANLVDGDTNLKLDVFVRDRQLGTTERVSVNSRRAQGDGDSIAPSISADGRYVAFESLATNLNGPDTNGSYDVLVRDRQLSVTERVTVDSTGVQGNSHSHDTAVSVDGRYVAFSSLATNLVPGDTNSRFDVFIRDRRATSFTSLCDPGQGGVTPCPCSNPPAGLGGGCDNFGAGPSDSGRLTATGASYLSDDTVVLHTTGENNTSLTVFWQGHGPVHPTGLPHGAGVRCVTTGLKRLYTGSASGGSISRPAMGDPPVSTIGGPINAGETRYYFTIYRDPQAATPCGNTSSTVNLTNAGSITWNL